MTKLIEAEFDSDKYIIGLDPAVLLDKAGKVVEAEYRCKGALIASLLVDQENNVVTLESSDLERRKIQISWLFQEEFDFNLKINLESCDLFLLGNIHLNNECHIDCNDLTLINDTKLGTGQSLLDATSIVISAARTRLQGIVGCSQGRRVSKLERFVLNSTGYVSVHGAIDSECCEMAVSANSFRTSGKINVSELRIDSTGKLVVDSKAVLVTQNRFHLCARELTHRGHLGCQKEPSSPNDNLIRGTESLSISGEICVDRQSSTRLSSSGSCSLTRRLLASNFTVDYPTEHVNILVSSYVVAELKRTFIVQARQDIASLKVYLRKGSIPEDMRANRREAFALLQAAFDASEEDSHQDSLVDAYKACLSRLKRSQTFLSCYLPAQSYWRPSEPMEAVLRDTLQKLNSGLIVGTFSASYSDFSAPSVIDTSSALVPNILSLLFPVLGTVARSTIAGVYLSQYAYPCYLLLNDRFVDAEKVIAFSSIIMLSSTLVYAGLSQYVNAMHSESMLIQDTLREFMSSIEKSEYDLDPRIVVMLRWLTNKSTGRSFLDRLAQLIIQMLISPINATLTSMTTAIAANSQATDLVFSFLRGVLITVTPAMRYLNVFNQTGEYIAGETIDNFSIRDFLCGAASFITHHYLGDSPATHRILNKALSQVKQAEPNLPIPEYVIGNSLSSFLKEQETMTARAVLWAGHAIKGGVLEELSKQFSNTNALPATFSESFYLVNQMLPSNSHLFVRYSASYLLSRVLEAQLTVDIARTKLKSLAKAQLIKTIFYKLISSMYHGVFGRTDQFSLFLSTDSDRPMSYYLLDIVVLLSISDMHERLEKTAGARSSSDKMKLVSSWLYMYYVLVSDYLMELYSDIANFSTTGDYKAFWSEHLVYHFLRISRTVSIGIAVSQHIRTGLDEIDAKQSLEKRKDAPVQEAEIIEEEDHAGSSDHLTVVGGPLFSPIENPEPAEVIEENPEVALVESEGGEGGGGCGEDVPNPSEIPPALVQVAEPDLQTEVLPSWIKAGGFFTGNRRMDILRYELLYMQVYASRHFLDAMMFGDFKSSGYESGSCSDKWRIHTKHERQDFITATDYVFRGWELLDATDRVLDRIQFCSSYHQTGKWKYGHSKKKKTKSRHESEFIKNKPSEFEKVNNCHYHGIAVRHKIYNITAILTAGTRVFDVPNLVAVYNLGIDAKPNKYFSEAGRVFVNYIKDTYLNGKYPGIYVGHSLGCSFSMWMNAVTKGRCYVLNIDAFGRSAKNIHRTCWHRNSCESDLIDSNVDSILGDDNKLNNNGKNHVGKVFKLDNSTSRSRGWKEVAKASIYTIPVAGPGIAAVANTIESAVAVIDHHDIDRIKKAYRRKLEADTDIDLENETIATTALGL